MDKVVDTSTNISHRLIELVTPTGNIIFPFGFLDQSQYIKNTLLSTDIINVIDSRLFLPFDKNIVKLLIPFLREGKIVVKNHQVNELISLLEYINKNSWICNELIMQLQYAKVNRYGFKIISNEYSIEKFPEVSHYTNMAEMTRQDEIIRLMKNVIRDTHKKLIVDKYLIEKQNSLLIFDKLFRSTTAINDIDVDHYTIDLMARLTFIVDKKITFQNKLNAKFNVSHKISVNDVLYGLDKGNVFIYYISKNLNSQHEADHELKNALHIIFGVDLATASETASHIYETIEFELYKLYKK